MSLGTRRIAVAVAVAGAIAVAVVGFAAPSYAMTEDQCSEQAVDAGDACIDLSGDGKYTLIQGSEDTSFGDDDMSGPGVPGWFVAFAIVAIGIGIATTAWKVTTARQLARDAGMDPDIATGMTLLDDNGLSAAYIASSVRTNRPTEPTEPSKPKVPLSSGTATERLTELKSLLDGA